MKDWHYITVNGSSITSRCACAHGTAVYRHSKSQCMCPRTNATQSLALFFLSLPPTNTHTHTAESSVLGAVHSPCGHSVAVRLLLLLLLLHLLFLSRSERRGGQIKEIQMHLWHLSASHYSLVPVSKDQLVFILEIQGICHF